MAKGLLCGPSVANMIATRLKQTELHDEILVWFQRMAELLGSVDLDRGASRSTKVIQISLKKPSLV
jgi:hypothetical protein